MKSGSYRHPITIQKLKSSVVLDTVDRSDDSNWETFVERRAKLEKRPGREWFEENQTQASISAVFAIRRDATTELTTPAMRVLAYGQVHEIVTAHVDGDKRTDVVIVCTQKR